MTGDDLEPRALSAAARVLGALADDEDLRGETRQALQEGDADRLWQALERAGIPRDLPPRECITLFRTVIVVLFDPLDGHFEKQCRAVLHERLSPEDGERLVEAARAEVEAREVIGLLEAFGLVECRDVWVPARGSVDVITTSFELCPGSPRPG